MGFNNLGEGEGYTKTPSIDNPQLLEILFNRYCPPDDKKHVIIEWHRYVEVEYHSVFHLLVREWSVTSIISV